MADEFRVADLAHSGELFDCPRCQWSDRPGCVGCGHALTGVVQGNGWTACQFCGLIQKMRLVGVVVGDDDCLYRAAALVWRSTVTVGDRVGRVIAWLVWAYRRLDGWLCDLYGASAPPTDDEIKDRLSGKR